MTPFKDRIIFSKKFISIVKRNNVKTQWWFLLFEMSSFLQNKKNKLESHKTVCKNQDFCDVVMPFEDPMILEFNQYQKSY